MQGVYRATQVHALRWHAATAMRVQHAPLRRKQTASRPLAGLAGRARCCLALLLLLTAHDSSELRSCSRCTVCSFAKADREGVSPVSRRTLLFKRCPITSACSVDRALMLSAGKGKRARAGVE